MSLYVYVNVNVLIMDVSFAQLQSLILRDFGNL